MKGNPRSKPPLRAPSTFTGFQFSPELIGVAHPSRHAADDRWLVDETYGKVNGLRRDVYRAVRQHGQVIGALSRRR